MALLFASVQQAACRPACRPGFRGTGSTGPPIVAPPSWHRPHLRPEPLTDTVTVLAVCRGL